MCIKINGVQERHRCRDDDMHYRGIKRLDGYDYEVWECAVCGYERKTRVDMVSDREWRD